MARRKHPVSTAAIRREIHKAQKKLAALRKKASPAQKKAISLEISVLKKCDKIAGDVKPV